jgi:hypothetical protein
MAGNSSHSAFQAAQTSRRSSSVRPSSMGVKTSPRRSAERLPT